MENLGQWAKQQLSDLMANSGKVLADQFHKFYSNVKPDDSQPQWDGKGVAPANLYGFYRFMDALQYIRTSDTSQLCRILCILQYGWAVEFLISFFRIEGLRESYISLFGFLFLLLLHRGNSVWMGDNFTQADRMALFSAQSFLTPLPASLKESILKPLFFKPSRDDFAAILSGDTPDHGKCPDEICSQ